eukprot:gene1611-33000_t
MLSRLPASCQPGSCRSERIGSFQLIHPRQVISRDMDLNRDSVPSVQSVQPLGQEVQLLTGDRYPNLTTSSIFAAGFGATAYDVFAQSSSHLLSGVDEAVHTCASALPPASQPFFDMFLSNLFIWPTFVAWLACSASVAAGASEQKSSKPVNAMIAAWFTNIMLNGDIPGAPGLVDALKEVFGRIRPNPSYHWTLSFPSGHTTDSVFLVSTLVFVLLPVALQYGRWPVESGSQEEESQRRGLLQKAQGSWMLVGAAWATTAVGRTLADAHWVTDTIAGGCCALSVTSLLSYWVLGYLSDDGEPKTAGTGSVYLPIFQHEEDDSRFP